MAHLVFAAAESSELTALRAVSAYFSGLGHHTEVYSAGIELGRRLHLGLPDVLIAELVLPGRDFFELMRDFADQPARARMGTVVLLSLTAELGGLLPLAWNWRSQIDYVVAKHPHGGSHLPDLLFREQVVLAIGRVMADRGLLAI